MFDSGFMGDFKEKIVELCFQLSQKEAGELIRLVEAQGKQVNRDGDTLRIRNKNFTCGVCLGSPPLDQLAPLMFALIGNLWPLAFADLHRDATKEICCITKTTRRNKQ